MHRIIINFCSVIFVQVSDLSLLFQCLYFSFSCYYLVCYYYLYDRYLFMCLSFRSANTESKIRKQRNVLCIFNSIRLDLKVKKKHIQTFTLL